MRCSRLARVVHPFETTLKRTPSGVTAKAVTAAIGGSPASFRVDVPVSGSPVRSASPGISVSAAADGSTVSFMTFSGSRTRSSAARSPRADDVASAGDGPSAVDTRAPSDPAVHPDSDATPSRRGTEQPDAGRRDTP